MQQLYITWIEFSSQVLYVYMNQISVFNLFVWLCFLGKEASISLKNHLKTNKHIKPFEKWKNWKKAKSTIWYIPEKARSAAQEHQTPSKTTEDENNSRTLKEVAASLSRSTRDAFVNGDNRVQTSGCTKELWENTLLLNFLN